MAGRYVPPHLRNKPSSKSVLEASDLIPASAAVSAHGPHDGFPDQDRNLLTLKEIHAYFWNHQDTSDSSHNTTLHSSAENPNGLAWVCLFHGANPKWDSEGIVFVKSNLEILPALTPSSEPPNNGNNVQHGRKIECTGVQQLEDLISATALQRLNEQVPAVQYGAWLQFPDVSSRPHLDSADNLRMLIEFAAAAGDPLSDHEHIVIDIDPDNPTGLLERVTGSGGQDGNFIPSQASLDRIITQFVELNSAGENLESANLGGQIRDVYFSPAALNLIITQLVERRSAVENSESTIEEGQAAVNPSASTPVDLPTEGATVDHPSIAVFSQPTRGRSGRCWKFIGWHKISKLALIEPQSEALVHMLAKKWETRDKYGRMKPQRRDSKAWEESMKHRWAVIKMRKDEQKRRDPIIEGIVEGDNGDQDGGIRLDGEGGGGKKSVNELLAQMRLKDQ